MRLPTHAVLALSLTTAFLFAARIPGTPCDEVVCVEVEETGKSVTFYATSRADGVSISFSVSALNMEPKSPAIVTRALRHGRTELITLRAIAGKKPTFSHGYFWEWGVAGATHDESVSYRLPFGSGKTFRLFQGPNGTLTHQKKFAYDFPMPPGTAVHAARAGMVAVVVDQFDEGGPDWQFSEMANHVLIAHDDGTIGGYFHLLRGGMKVKPGDRVEAGSVIGLSGNSGVSTGPHLHFEVFRLGDGLRRETLPIRFRTANGTGIVLEEGKVYRAD